ncbi:hypothetical protein AMECASPLE_028585 [Ameca splendens]|uniref:Uncharacterized protein n=1 Tax=Ameca splendens TaxID=208324 RepID=A0ABV0ZQD5_9TELE
MKRFIIGILTQIIPMSMDHLRVTVDTVHRLGRKTNPATSNNQLRAVMIKFGMCTVQDEVWKKSKDAKVCKDLHISFKEDFSKEDRLARAKLWPLVQEARSRGRRPYLKEGYALIKEWIPSNHFTFYSLFSLRDMFLLIYDTFHYLSLTVIGYVILLIPAHRS